MVGVWQHMILLRENCFFGFFCSVILLTKILMRVLVLFFSDYLYLFHLYFFLPQVTILASPNLLAPEGKGPLALNLSSMGKGQAWVNGQSIGRYWTAYLSPSTGCTDNCDYRGTYDPYKCLKDCGQPAQTL